MASDFFNQPPQGYVRTEGGWLRMAKTPQRQQVKRLRNENEELKSRLEQLEQAVSELANKKKKK